MGVDRQRGVAGEGEQAGEADAGEARHHAGAAEGEHEVVAAAHLVDLAGEVEGEHQLAAGAVGGAVDLAHHRAGALLERAGRAVALQLVVLDEVEPGGGELGDQRGGRLGVEADRRLDDGADQRPALDAGERAGAGNAELRAGVGGGEGLGQAQVEEAQAGELLELEEIAGDGRHQVRAATARCCRAARTG